MPARPASWQKTGWVKTGWVDAEMLARMGRALELQPTPPTPPERVEMAELVARRDDLVAMMGAERHRLGQSHNAWIRTQITGSGADAQT